MKHSERCSGRSEGAMVPPPAIRRLPRFGPLACLLVVALIATAALDSSGIPTADGAKASGQPLYAGASLQVAEPADEPPFRPDPSGVPARTALFREIWGMVTIDGEPAPVGTVVTAHTARGQLVGKFAVTQPGRYGYVRIYGEHQAAGRLLEGMRADEEILFAVDGELAEVAVGRARWENDRRPSRVDLAVVTR